MATDGKPQEVAVMMESVPAYLRGGHIMARKERARRSTAAMAADPITLVKLLCVLGGFVFREDSLCKTCSHLWHELLSAPAARLPLPQTPSPW